MTAQAAKRTDFYAELALAGFTYFHTSVLSCLFEAAMETGQLAEGDPTVHLSLYDIQRVTGFSNSQVQRTIAGLVKLGCLARDQLVKKSGQIARTLLLPKGLRLMGYDDAGVPKRDIPAEVSTLLIGEDIAVIKAVTDAWAETAPCPTSIEPLFRGGGYRLEQLRLLFDERTVARHERVLEAIQVEDARREADERGEYTLTLPNGNDVTLSRDAFREAAGDLGSTRADLRFTRDTVERLAAIAPEMVTPKTLPRLVADIAFSRANGFVRTRDAADAMRILASCVQRSTWSKPQKMGQHWYSAAAAALSLRNLSTGSSKAQH